MGFSIWKRHRLTFLVILASIIVGVVILVLVVPRPDPTGLLEQELEGQLLSLDPEDIRNWKLETKSQKKMRPVWIHSARGLNEMYAGNYEGAVSWYEEALKLLPTNRDLQKFIAIAYSYTYRYADAMQVFGQLGDIRIGRSADLQDAKRLDSLAQVLCDHWKYDQAEQLYQEAFYIRKRLLGVDDPDMVISLDNMGRVAYYQRKYKVAQDLYSLALQTLEHTVGPGHPDVADMLNNIGVIYFDQGRYAEAEPLFRRALDIKENALGSGHPEVANQLLHLGEAYRFQHQYIQAESLFTRALAIQEKVYGTEHEEVAVVLYSLADMYKDMKRYSEAEPLFMRAIEIIEETPGHPNLSDYVREYSEMLYETGRETEATQIMIRMNKMLQ
jgi:tetratricopeptide (TPR) repeat protein